MPQLSGRGDKFRGRLIVASNREPYSHRKTDRGLEWEISVGGVVSALDTVLKVTGGSFDDVRNRVGLPGLVYAGSHGTEMESGKVGDGGRRVTLEEFLTVAHQAFACLPGVQIEDKGLTASLSGR